MNRLKGYKKIHFSEEETWLYKVGESQIVIYSPKWKRTNLSHEQLFEEIISTEYIVYDKMWGEHRSIFPSDVKQYIEKKLRNV